MAKPILDAERVRQVFHYDPETGLFTRIGGSIWKPHHKGSVPVGRKPSPSGYISLTMDGQSYPAHRLAFVYMTGRQPADQIDHINGIRHDNRWCNLREATAKQNSENCGLRKGTHSGFRGVYPAGNGKWIARIGDAGVRHYLGIHDTPEQASEAYKAARAARFAAQPVAREHL